MNTREQFGKYLLLKKLTEDPLGETFRAGMVGSGGMERVVLLRIFNGQGIDGGRLWEAVKDRGAVQEALKSPNIGEGVELGEIEDIPYVAYDYVSGKNMANLLEQAARQRNFVPAEHALLITERLALALSSAAETRFGDSRIFHGFMVPHLVIISNEGETRLLGFEVGPGLRTFASNPVVRQHFGRYMSPETLSGAPASKVDDIYSLGVVLFELLTGRPLPPPAQDGYASIIDQGVVATAGEAIPAELRDLLKKSLVPREQRIQDVVDWHKALNKYMFEGDYNPTTFNLAFFMHNLFRQEIERESQEIEIEKTLPVPTRAGKAAATEKPAEAEEEGEGTEPGAAPAPPTGPVPAGEPSGIHETAPPPQKPSTGLVIGAVAALLLVLAVGGYFFLQDGDAGDETAVEQPPPEPQGPSPEEIQAKIEELAAQQSEMMQQQFEEAQAHLLEQLEEAQRRQAEAEERRRREAEARRQAELQAEERQAELEAQQQAEEEAAEEEAAAAEVAEAEDQTTADEPEEETEETRVAEAEQERPPTPTPAVPTPTPTPTPIPDTSEAESETQPVEPKVRRGDLVEMGPGVKAPEPIRKPRPSFPEMARRFNRQGATVLVRALIDENGRVVKTELASSPQKFGFDQEAVSAVKKSLYEPATKDGVPVKFWHTIAVEFRQ